MLLALSFRAVPCRGVSGVFSVRRARISFAMLTLASPRSSLPASIRRAGSRAATTAGSVSGFAVNERRDALGTSSMRRLLAEGLFAGHQ